MVTAERKKVRYHNTETKTFAWANREDLPEYAFEQPDVQKQLASKPISQPDGEDVVLDEPRDSGKINDYSADIEQWRTELRLAVGDMRAGRDAQQRFIARNRAEQYKMAIDIYTAAEYIPAVNTQFGSYRSDFHFRVPPRLEEYDDISPLKRGTAHRYITSDPVEIAYLRTLDEFEEVPVGHVYSRGEGKRDGIWVPLDTYLKQKAIGQAV